MKNFFGKEISDEEWNSIMNDFFEVVEKENVYNHRQEDRISKFIEKLSQEEIEQWMDKFLKWEDEYEEYCYTERHVLTNSEIFSHLIDVLESKGKPIRIYRDEDFCTGGFKWNKYRFKLYQGQGAFWRIWKGRKVIFTNI
jgi:hypothetical protein